METLDVNNLSIVKNINSQKGKTVRVTVKISPNERLACEDAILYISPEFIEDIPKKSDYHHINLKSHDFKKPLVLSTTKHFNDDNVNHFCILKVNAKKILKQNECVDCSAVDDPDYDIKNYLEVLAKLKKKVAKMAIVHNLDDEFNKVKNEVPNIVKLHPSLFQLKYEVSYEILE